MEDRLVRSHYGCRRSVRTWFQSDLAGERGRNRTFNLLIKSRKSRQKEINDLDYLNQLYEWFARHSAYAILRLFSHGFCAFMTKECQSH